MQISSRSRAAHRARPPVRLGALAVAIALAVTVSVSAAASPARAATASPGAWVRPVAGAVERPFVEPSGPYGAGHRGVDLAAAAGTPVRAAGAGVVAFAGLIAGSWHVTVAHAGGLRTSYSFLASVSVREGQAVARGDVLGTTGGTGPAHDGQVLHLGLRIGSRYVDPMVLFRPADLTKLVHLVPSEAPHEEAWSSVAERVALVGSLALPGSGPSASADARLASAHDDGCGDGVPLVGAALDAVCDVGGWLGDHAADALDAGLWFVHRVTGIAPAALAALGSTLHAVIAAARKLGELAASRLARTPAGRLALSLVEIGRRFVAAVTAQCSTDAPAADGTGGSRHRVMVVAGVNSSGAAWDRGPTVSVDVAALGYHVEEGEVRYFSYARDGGPYTEEDTYEPIEQAARYLGDQLRAMEREQPGREVDLIAHSQGGIVVDWFLTHLYRPGDPTLPPLGNVVTLSSPHQGAPLATTSSRLRRRAAGRALTDAIAAHTPIPPPGATSVQELAAGSTLMRHLWKQGIPAHFDFTTIGAAEDYVVPANQISVPGAQEATVATGSLGAHHAVVQDPDTLRTVRAAMEHRPLPCVGLGTAIEAAVFPVVISRLELTPGELTP